MRDEGTRGAAWPGRFGPDDGRDPARRAADGWGIPRQGWFALWGVDVLALLLLVGLVTAVGMNGLASRTLHRFDVSEVCAVAVLPAEIAVLAMVGPDGWWLALVERLSEKEAGAVLNAAAGLFILMVLLPVNLALGLNQWGDRSGARLVRLPVLDKDYSVHRSTHTYYVTVEPPGRSPLRPGSAFHVGLLDGPQRVRMPRAEWEGAEPGRSGVTLAMHPGLFGFAWYEDGARLAP